MDKIYSKVNEWPQNNWDLVTDVNIAFARRKYLPFDEEIDAQYAELARRGEIPSAEEEQHND